MRKPRSLPDLFLNFSEEEKQEFMLDVAQKATEQQLETLEKFSENKENKDLEGQKEGC